MGARRSKRYGRQVEFDPPPPTTAIGVVVPFDFNLDWEYWGYLPDEVAFHFTRTPHLNLEVGVGLARGVGRPKVVARASQALSAIKPSAVLYACSSGSFVDGVAGERAICEAMVGAGAPAAVTTAGATVDALRVTGMRRVAVATPYTAGLTTRFCGFLEEAGFDVVSAHHLGVTADISRISKATIADLVREANGCDADAVVLSCTALRTWGIIRELEGELGRPVFTSNQVSLWAVLRAAGVGMGAASGPRRGSWALGGDDPACSTRLLLQADSQLLGSGAA